MTESPDLGRYDDWLAWLREQGETDADVRVVFVGGSAVTGGYDDHSDLDVEVLTTPGEAVSTYRRLLDAALDDFDVAHVWELPETTYPDGRQAFLHLSDDAAMWRLARKRAAPLAQVVRSGSAGSDEPRSTRIIDLHVSDLSDEHRLVDERRHGVPHVVHDPDGLVELRHDDEESMARARQEAVEQAAARRPTAEWLVNRALARGDEVEAVAFHLGYGVNPLVRLLRIKHCPARHDFGLRYLRTDLPPGYAERVAALMPGPDLAERARATFAWQDELLAELKA
jgi:predicted nucleotidyltransferase